MAYVKELNMAKHAYGLSALFLIIAIIFFVYSARLEQARLRYMLQDIQMQWKKYNEALFITSERNEAIKLCYRQIEDRFRDSGDKSTIWITDAIKKCNK